MILRSRTNAQGFTLIELIVSLTIMAMVSAAVLSGLRTGLQVWDKGTNHVDELRRSRLVVQLMHDSIGSALPFMYTVRDGEARSRKLAFDAAPDHVRFVSRVSFKDGPGSVPRWIDIRWVPGAEKKPGQLVADERIVLPPDNLPDANVYWSGNLLSADSCAFEFLDSAPAEKSLEWTRDWRPLAEHLPKAIRVRCTARSGDMVLVDALDYAPSFTAGMRLN